MHVFIIGVTNTVQPVPKVSWGARKLARTSEQSRYEEDTIAVLKGCSGVAEKDIKTPWVIKDEKNPRFFPNQ